MEKNKNAPNTEGGQIVNNNATVQTQINIHTFNGSMSDIKNKETDQSAFVNYKEYLEDLLFKGELEQILEEFLQATKNNGQKSLYQDVLHQAGRNSNNETQKRKGVISDEFYARTRNQIRAAIGDLLENYKDDGQLMQEIKEESKKEAAKLEFVPLKKEDLEVNYSNKPFNYIQHFIERGLILLVTATKTETDALLQQITPLSGEEGILKVKNSSSNLTYYIGQFGNFVVAHVECGDMGASSSMGSIITVNDAIKDINPKFVLMVGIAFGIDETEQHIGDVLVSNIVIPYQKQRIGNDSIIQRGPKPESSNYLRGCFKNSRAWKYKLPNGFMAQIDFCDMLSGDVLVDNIDYRKELQQKFPTAKGGEMEGAGVYAACHDKRTEWLLVKAICDFADGDKKKHKKEKQALAIDVALSACLEVFKDKYVFEGLGVVAYQNEEKNMSNSKNEMKNKIETAVMIELLKSDKIPQLFKSLDTIDMDNLFQYNRFKKEYQAGLRGSDFLDWVDRMDVFINGLK